MSADNCLVFCEEGVEIEFTWRGANLEIRVEVLGSCPGDGAVDSFPIDEEKARALEAFAKGVLRSVGEVNAIARRGRLGPIGKTGGAE